MSHNTNGFSDIAATALCKIIRLKKYDNSWGDVLQRYEGGAANTKNLKTKGRDLKYETSLRINTFLYDELDIYVRVWLILTLAKPVFVFI